MKVSAVILVACVLSFLVLMGAGAVFSSWEDRTLVDYMRDEREAILYTREKTELALTKLFQNDTETARILLHDVIYGLGDAINYSNGIKELLIKLDLWELSEVMADVISHLDDARRDVEYALVKIYQDEIEQAIFAVNDAMYLLTYVSEKFGQLEWIPLKITEPAQDPSEGIQPDQNVTVTVNITDYGVGISRVSLCYSTDNGTIWNIEDMINVSSSTHQEGINHNGIEITYTIVTYQATILEHEYCTWVTYKIVAYDNAGNNSTKADNDHGYKYHVIPEFSSTITLLATIIIATTAIIIEKKEISVSRC